MNVRKIRPSWWWYIVSAAIAVVFVTASLVFLAVLIVGEISGFERVVVPATDKLGLSSAGEYIIFHEYDSVLRGEVFSTGQCDISNLRCSVKKQGSEREIGVSSAKSGWFRYEIGKRRGTAISRFGIDEPGTYILTGEYTDGSTEPRIVLSIKKNTLRKVVPAVCIAVACAMLSIVNAVAICAVVFLKRRKAKRALVSSN